MDSAIGLSTMLAVGPDGFRELLAGFHAMDEHFRTTPLERNLPVLMGLLCVWYADFFGAQTYGVMPYSQYLKRFPAYLQQLTMESNGKQRHARRPPRRLRDRRRLLGRAGDERPAQLLPADPPGHEADPGRPDRLREDARIRSATTTTSSCRTCSRRPRRSRSARPRTRCAPRARPRRSCPHRVFEGNRPSNVLLAEELTPHTLGALVALYEHSVFTQGTDLGDQLLRPVGRRARQGARAADRPGAYERGRARARARLVDERAHPALPGPAR